MKAGTKRFKVLSCFMAVVLALGVSTLGAVPLSEQALADDAGSQTGALSASSFKVQEAEYDITWYSGSSPYTITNVRQLKGLAYLVNSGADTFEGDIVQLSALSLIFSNNSIEPIGSKDHPFQGTFDGNDVQITNLTLKSSGMLSYVGLFGYAGEKAAIKNVKLTGGKVAVSNTGNGQRIEYVGAIAGYLGGNMSDCYSTAEVAITNNGTVPSGKGTAPRELCTISHIGGLVGCIEGNLTNCTHADKALSITSKTNVTEDVPYIAGFVGGVAGFQGVASDASHVTKAIGCKNTGKLSFNVSGVGGLDRFQAQMYSSSAMVGGIVGYTMGDVSECSNTAEIQTSFLNKGVTAVGFGASTTGGIVGSLRGPTITNPYAGSGVVGANTTDPGYDVWKKNKGSSGSNSAPETVSVTQCSNSGRIVGLSSVGGICGTIGAFTAVSGCANTGKVDGTRWNKPCPAGIVGISYGDITYCSNTGNIETLDGGGYYASGICGIFTSHNESSTAANLLMDAPVMYGCYVTGSIISSKAGYRSAVFAGENDGYIHDNCYIPNLTLDKDVPEEWEAVLGYIGDDKNPVIAGEHVDEVKEAVERINTLEGFSAAEKFAVVTSGGTSKLTGGPARASNPSADVKADFKGYCNRCQLVSPGMNRGTVSGNHELTMAELRSSKGVALLNRVSAMSQGWERFYYVPNSSASGFPLLEWQEGGITSTVDLSTVVTGATLVSNPQYSSVITPVPTVALTTGDGRTLYQNADFKVIPQNGATAVTADTPYEATVEGINAYTGTLGTTVAYGIDKCDIGVCTVLAGSQTFNWQPQKPAWVKVLDEAGQEVSSDQYTWDRVDFDAANTKVDRNKKYHDYTNVHTNGYKYDIKVTANDSSVNYTGSTTQAAFRIDYANLMHATAESESESYCNFDKVVWDNQSWDYVSASKTKGLVKIKYTGKPIEPIIANPTYRGEKLRDGTKAAYWDAPLDYDFRYVYGNANAEDSNTVSTDCINVTGSDEKSLACMTIRFIAGSNFTNYSNIFFEITPASIDEVQVSGLGGSFPYTGKQVKPSPKLTYNGQAVSSDNYSLSYSNNTKLGTATIKITGKKNFTGSRTLHFKIGKGVQPLKVKASKKTVSQKKLARQAATVAPLKVTKSVGKVTYKNTSTKTALKKFKVTSKGKIIVPKGTKKGVYKVKVKVTAKGNKLYAKGSKTVTAIIQVK